MNNSVNTFKTNMLEQKNLHAPQHVLNAIEQASAQSGVDFSYLVQQAAVESSFNPAAKAKTSSASGLYQFLDSTWMDMVNRYGDEYGLDIAGKSKQEILALRHDPKSASFMAAAFASENERTLNENWGGKVGATELYFAHFLGASGASSFLNARDENPLQTAADIFPKAAQSNRNVFYDPKTGRPRTLEEVYQFFDNKFQTNGTEGLSSEALLAQAPTLPQPSDPAEKSVKTFSISHDLSDSIVMQRAAQMRAERAGNTNYMDTARDNGLTTRLARTALNNAANVQTSLADPLSQYKSLIANPVDMMFFTQTTMPSKVIRDNA